MIEVGTNLNHQALMFRELHLEAGPGFNRSDL
jgi:hypothetical protein